MRYFVSDHWQIEWLIGLYSSPIGTDAGALSLNEIAVNRFAANARNKDFDAGETVKGLMTALVSKYFINDRSTFQSNVFYRKRDFTARLPFEAGGWVSLSRDFVGTNLSYLYQGFSNTLVTVGSSLEYQSDHRELSKNIKGQRGDLTANQIENVQNISLFQQIQWSKNKLELHQLLRWDVNNYRLIDRFANDGIQDGNQSFSNINGAMGIGYKMNRHNHIFSNFSTSFEMPTLNELTNNPNGPGFNPDLSPEKSWQVELGHRFDNKTNFNIHTSIFYINLSDQIVSYELPDTPGRSFYRNATTTSRRGIENAISFIPKKRWLIEFNYTFSDFKYGRFISGNVDFTGNYQTLIPKHKLQLNFIVPFGKIIDSQFNFGYNDEMWLDDANSQKSASYGDINFSVQTNEKFSKKLQIGLLGNNLFNIMTYSNFRVNAVASRYYEVATPMNFGCFAKVKW